MDGRGRWLDNRFIERLWWRTKHEDLYRQDDGDGLAAGRGLEQWFTHDNTHRPPQALDYARPAQWSASPEEDGGAPASWEAMQAPPPAPPRRAVARASAPPGRDERDDF